MDLPDYRLRHAEKIRHYEYNGIRCYELFPQDISRPYWEPRLIDAIRNASPSSHLRFLVTPPPETGFLKPILTIVFGV